MSAALFSRDLSDSEDEELLATPADRPATAIVTTKAFSQPPTSSSERNTAKNVVTQGVETTEARIEQGEELTKKSLPIEKDPSNSSSISPKEKEGKKTKDRAKEQPSKPKEKRSEDRGGGGKEDVYLVDRLLLSLLQALDRYESLQDRLSKNLSNGFFNLSCAKYKQSSPSSSFPSSENLRPTLQENLFLIEAENEEEEGEEGDEMFCWEIKEKKKPEEHLLSFHGLPSWNLKKAQKDFHSILSLDMAELAKEKQRIERLCRRIEELKRKG